MDSNFGARGRERRGIEVKVVIYGSVVGTNWVRARGTEQIDIEDCLGDETVPLFGWEVGVTRGQSSAKVIIEGTNCTFGGVAVMDIWGDKLEVDILFADGALHSAGLFVVKDVESGFCTVLFDIFVARYLVVGDFEVLAFLQKVGVD